MIPLFLSSAMVNASAGIGAGCMTRLATRHQFRSTAPSKSARPTYCCGICLRAQTRFLSIFIGEHRIILAIMSSGMSHTSLRYVAGTLLEITYGQRLTSMNDPIVQLAERAVNATNESGSPGSMLVDFFPICGFHVKVDTWDCMLIMIDLVPHFSVKHLPTWLPIAGFKQHAL